MATPLTEVNVHEAKTHLSRLLRRVAGGEEIVIARAGVPVARLVPVEERPKRIFGVDRGRFQVPEDFDAPLPEEVLRSFEG
jgi:prevent-host-death family protein